MYAAAWYRQPAVGDTVEGVYRLQNAEATNETLLVHHVAATFELVYAFALGLAAGGSPFDDGLEIVRVSAKSEEPEVVWTYLPDDQAFAADADRMRRLLQTSARPELN